VKHLKTYKQHIDEQLIDDYTGPKAPSSLIGKKYKPKSKKWWMHNIDKETGNITLAKPYGVHNKDGNGKMDFTGGSGVGIFTESQQVNEAMQDRKQLANSLLPILLKKKKTNGRLPYKDATKILYTNKEKSELYLISEWADNEEHILKLKEILNRIWTECPILKTRKTFAEVIKGLDPEWELKSPNWSVRVKSDDFTRDTDDATGSGRLTRGKYNPPNLPG